MHWCADFRVVFLWQADHCLADLRRTLWEKEREWHLLISEERAGVDVDGAGAGGEEADASGTMGGAYSRADVEACEKKVRELRDKVYMYVCVYACVYVYTYIHTYCVLINPPIPSSPLYLLRVFTSCLNFAS